LKRPAFWDVAMYSKIDTDRRFRGDYCLHQISLMMEAISTSETSVNIYQTTRQNIP
jgi:hypothetical protein